MQGKKIGSFLTLIAGVLAAVACVVYIFAYYKLPAVFIFLILAAVVSGCAFAGVNKIVTGIAPVIVAVLASSAVIWSVNPMVNQLGYVISGLDDISTVMSFIIAAALMAVSMIVAIVSSFLPQIENTVDV